MTAASAPTHPPVISRPTAVVKSLLVWFARHGRQLPWRASRDPYRVWVSEIMLQQTQVERVRDYFLRFIDRFPDVHALANARESEVLAAWEGLGYYRRGRSLHAAARLVAEKHGGRFPESIEGLQSLPGIGRYTSAAIASIAFGLPEPVVEANSRRVLARLAGHTSPLGGPAGDEAVWELGRSIVGHGGFPRGEAGRFNQALMDLGATVCTPRRPRCTACPLAELCVAKQKGLTERIPAMARRRASVARREVAIVARRGGRVLLVRRGAGEWWTGMWDFPRARSVTSQEVLEAINRGASLGTIRHSVTHHRIELTAVVMSVAAARAAAVLPDSRSARRWVALVDLDGLPMTAPARRLSRLL